MRFLKNLLVTILLLSTQLIVAQQNQEDRIKEVIALFFKGLQNGDTLTIKKTISNELKLQTIFNNKEGKSVLRDDNIVGFLNAIASKKKEDIWEERLLSYHIKIDGSMANVWTPYKFYLNNDFSHCGVNSFQLFLDEFQWKIIYLIDTRRNQDCKK